jgi:hypothetical protein
LLGYSLNRILLIEASIKSQFVGDLRQVGGFSLGPLVSSTNTTGRHDITEILFESGIKHHNFYFFLILITSLFEIAA